MSPVNVVPEVEIYKRAGSIEEDSNSRDSFAVVRLGSGYNCDVNGCERYSLRERRLGKSVSSRMHDKVCSAQNDGLFTCFHRTTVDLKHERSSRPRRSFFRTRLRDVSNRLSQVGGYRPLVTGGGAGITSDAFRGNIGIFNSNVSAAINAYSDPISGAFFSQQLTTSLNNINTSLDQFFSATLGAGANATGAADAINAELNNINRDILNGLGSEELKHQAQQLKDQLKELQDLQKDEELSSSSSSSSSSSYSSSSYSQSPPGQTCGGSGQGGQGQGGQGQQQNQNQNIAQQILQQLIQQALQALMQALQGGGQQQQGQQGQSDQGSQAEQSDEQQAQGEQKDDEQGDGQLGSSSSSSTSSSARATSTSISRSGGELRHRRGRFNLGGDESADRPSEVEPENRF